MTKSFTAIIMDAWLGRMASGMTKTQVFNGFADSAEFAGICRDYGIKK